MYGLGIDVGTTRTTAAVRLAGAGVAEVVALGRSAAGPVDSLPSALHADGYGALQLPTDPLGADEPAVDEIAARVGDPAPVLVDGAAWTAEDLLAVLVSRVVDRVCAHRGGPPAAVTLARPAWWDARRCALATAALAGRGVPACLIAQPVAAATRYEASHPVPVGSVLAVYDLGATRFEATVLRRVARPDQPTGGPDGFVGIGPVSPSIPVGGRDFDEAVLRHVRSARPAALAAAGHPGAPDIADPTDPATTAAVRQACRLAKETLSRDTEVELALRLADTAVSVRLHRSEFEDLVRPAVARTADALLRAVTAAGTTPAELAAVLLIGGSAQVPLVAQLVSERLGRAVTVLPEPQHAAALGAALAAGRRAGFGTGARPGPVDEHGWDGVTGPLPCAVRPLRTGPPRPPLTRPTPTPRPDPARPARPSTTAAAHPADPPTTAAPLTNAPAPAVAPSTGAAARAARPGPARPGRRAGPGSFVAAGGAAAAVAVIAAAFLWPGNLPVVEPEWVPIGSVPEQPITVGPPDPTVAPSEPARPTDPKPLDQDDEPTTPPRADDDPPPTTTSKPSPSGAPPSTTRSSPTPTPTTPPPPTPTPTPSPTTTPAPPSSSAPVPPAFRAQRQPDPRTV